MNAENVEQLSLFEDEEKEVTTTDNALEEDEGFKELVYSRMRQIHNEGMVVGLQTACHTALNKIYAFESSAGKKSANDYKRCLKDLKKFFETGISRKANSNVTTESEENTEVETTQN
jgi:ribosome-binding ATPase YchF (GTP1/OBG family)